MVLTDVVFFVSHCQESGAQRRGALQIWFYLTPLSRRSLSRTLLGTEGPVRDAAGDITRKRYAVSVGIEILNL